MELTTQLRLLEQRQLINPELSAIMLRIEQRLQQFWRVDVHTKQVEMELLHLAMALGRIKRGCAAQPLNKEMFAEMQSAENFSSILLIHKDILSHIPFVVPESEQTHLIANWYSLSLAQPWILDVLK